MSDIIIGKRKFRNAADSHKEWLKDPAYKAAYDALEEEFRIAEEFIKARLERKMSQAELAKKAGMQQEAIARLESFDSNPTRKTLARVAKALDKKISLV